MVEELVVAVAADRPRLRAGQCGIIHVHSDYSHDGRDSLEGLREFALEREIAFVGLTDHAEDFDEAIFDRYVRHCRSLSDERVTLIPGLEYRFEGHPGLHLLALGLSRWIEPRTPLEFTSLAGGAATLTIVAHPVLTKYRVPREVLFGVDGIEVWNAGYNTRYLPDPQAIRLATAVQRFRPELVAIAGLDQHDGRNDREVRVELTHGGEDPLLELKAGRFLNVGKTMRFGPNSRWSFFRLELLYATRWIFDIVERTQDHLVRLRRRRGSGRSVG